MGEVSGGYGNLQGSIKTYGFSRRREQRATFCTSCVGSTIETNQDFSPKESKVYALSPKEQEGSR